MTTLDSLAKVLVDDQKAVEAGEKKEKARLALKPFVTKVEPISKQTLDNLKGWREPQGAYVLYEKKYREWGQDKNGEVTFSTHTLLIGVRPDQGAKIEWYVRAKGMRVIHWGNFPKINDADPKRAAIAKQHVDPATGVCKFDELEAILMRLIGTDTSTKDIEMNDLKAKLAAAEKKAKELEKKAGA